VPLIPNGSTSGTTLCHPGALKVRFENHLILGVRDSRRVRDTACLGHPSVSGTALISPKWVRQVILDALHACHTAEGLSALLHFTSHVTPRTRMACDTVTSTPVVPGLVAISTTGKIIGLILSRFYLHISRRKGVLLGVDDEPEGKGRPRRG
jgi:hypothetical protein